MPPPKRWTILWIGQALIPGGWEIRVMTDVAVHLQLIWRKDPPWKHKKVVIDRGIAMWEDARFCMGKRFIVYQEEEGDTRNHTFIWTGWELCQTHYFHFQATTPGMVQPYPTPVFSKHYIGPPRTVTFRPDPHPERTCCDGGVEASIGYYGVPWANLWSGPAKNASAEGAQTTAGFGSGDTEDYWRYMWRGFLLFDTSSIGKGSTILGAHLRLRGSGKTYSDPWDYSQACIVTAWPLNNATIILADYRNIGTYLLSSTFIRWADWKVDDWNEFILNAPGENNINKTGITKFGVREARYDRANRAPVWQQHKSVYVQWWCADYLLGQFSPELVVAYQPG